ncbi:hypothetical protein GMOD_00002056 [Pyrenophora seminiperda CCB06]|uniref:Uncharacterized protein n=1 Tax=Pyrenophora seminiperda CCB06 TaxID=1302712 RepID=A0A3M7LX03_9PLEO|nr:hypothetical protein GMOD_00002056 [Pyrenophora seminiperda CCB06]
MSFPRITTDLFLALIVLTSTILVLLLIYFLIRFKNRDNHIDLHHQDVEPGLLDPESGRELRLSYRLSRQQIQQEHYKDPRQHLSSAPPSPSIELLPEIETSSSDDRADEWLERGVINSGIRMVNHDLGEKRPELQQAIIINRKKQLRWDWRDGNEKTSDDDLPKVLREVDRVGMVLTEHQAE